MSEFNIKDIVKLEDKSNAYYIVENNSISIVGRNTIECRQLYFYPTYTSEGNLYYLRVDKLTIVTTQQVRERQIKVLFGFYG